MADYTQPDVVQKRVRFFDGQFLQDQDFIDEQRYHLDRERRQSRLLNVTGVVSGLTVTKAGAYQVTVAKGMAVDDLGRQLVLADDLTLRLTDKFAKQQGIEVRLIYQETPTDVAQTGGESARRWDESPKIAALAPDGTVAVAPDGAASTWEGPTVLLAHLAVAGNGDVTVDTTVTGKAGLSVPGYVGIGTTDPEAKLHVAGGAIMPSAGNDEGAGIMFPKDPGGGAGDAAWIRYYPRSGEATTLEIGTANDPDDHIALMPSGNVGVNTTTPQGTLDVARGTAQGGTLQIRGTDRFSNFNYSSDEHTYIRGGKNASNVYLNDNGGNVAIGSTDTQECRLFVNGPAKVLGLRINSNYQFNRVQAGHFKIGSSESGTPQTAIKFDNPFTNTPNAVATVRGEMTNAPDTFAVTVRSIDTTGFSVNVCRVDQPGGWGQTLWLDWIAWE